jgi:SAM-dependent methyltransferase
MHDSKYDNYAKWKDWNQFFQPSKQESTLFQKEFQHVSFDGKKILDIGFGSGSLLAWARLQGAKIAGVEIQSSLLIEAQKIGVDVYSSLNALSDNSFDIVTAFDVLEHVSANEIPNMLQQVLRICKEGALVFFRVPNCQSPAGLATQFGDPTHVSMLSGPLLEVMLRNAGFKEINYKEAVMIASTKPLQNWAKIVLKPVQWLFILVYRLTWSIGTAPLTPNVIVQAKK